MRVLYVYPNYGELGWQVMCWMPHVLWEFRENGPFDHTFASVREGHEGLYPFIDEFETFNEHADCTEGNAFVLHRPDAYKHYKQHCERCDISVKKLGQSGHDVHVVRLPAKNYRYHRFKERHRVFEHIQPSSECLGRWRSSINSDAVIFHLRHIKRSTKKNTPLDAYRAAARWAEKNNKQFVTVGNTQGAKIKFPISGTNLLNKTTIDDLIAIFKLGGMVVGSSSGPMHLAAAVGTPHVVWGGGRNSIRERYLKEWNKLGTPVDHLTTKFSVDTAKLARAMSIMAARM